MEYWQSIKGHCESVSIDQTEGDLKMFLINSDRPKNKDINQVCVDNNGHQLLRFGLVSGVLKSSRSSSSQTFRGNILQKFQVY